MIIYRGKMVEASDSFFNLRDFSREKEKLDIYERDKTQHHIDELRRRVWYAAILVFAEGVVLIVILVYSKKIDRARMALVSRNETLLKENERLRDQLAATVTEEVPEPGLSSAQESQKTESETNEEGGQSVGGERKLQISAELRKNLESRILAIMNDRNTVFSPDFNINMLALELGTNTRYVSEVVKGLGASNFRNFINEYRIREACRRLADTKGYGHLTIAAIAGEVGFNSDNSFLLAFKRIMGMTPTRYRELAGKIKEGQTPSL